MSHTSHNVVIFTDGSSRGNPGPGGFGAIVIAPKNNEVGSTNYEVQEIGGREERTTNNRMELQAAISALSAIHTSSVIIHIYTDSAYLVNGITKWVYSWERRNWVTIDKKPVLNKDLWETLLKLVQGKRIEWKTVSGHVGVPGNVRCDEIATAFAADVPPSLYNGALAQYPIKNILDLKQNTSLVDKKASGKAHSNAKAYSYVSLVDGKIQTHTTWAECEARVKGKSAKFKKVLSAEEEKALIAEWSR